MHSWSVKQTKIYCSVVFSCLIALLVCSYLVSYNGRPSATSFYRHQAMAFPEDFPPRTERLSLLQTNVTIAELITSGTAFYKITFSEEMVAAVNGSPFEPLPSFKSPCWMSKLDRPDCYENRTVYHRCDRVSDYYKTEMRQISKNRLQNGQHWRMRCFPYAMLIGVSKSGTTDIFGRIVMHPEIFSSAVKETWFWSRYRIRVAPKPTKVVFGEYVDCFDKAAEDIRQYEVSDGSAVSHPGITMEGTPHYLWDYRGWQRVPGNIGLPEPRFILAHTFYALWKEFKFVVILRNPVSRLYSMYKMFSKPDFTPELFHTYVIKTLALWKECLTWNTERGCAYNESLIPWEHPDKSTRPYVGGLTIRAGMYYIFLNDWFQVFPRSQFHIIQADNYYRDIPRTLNSIFDFLGVRCLTRSEFESMDIGRIRKSRAGPPQLPETERLLDDFYRPHNMKLAELLNDEQYLW